MTDSELYSIMRTNVPCDEPKPVRRQLSAADERRIDARRRAPADATAVGRAQRVGGVVGAPLAGDLHHGRAAEQHVRAMVAVHVERLHVAPRQRPTRAARRRRAHLFRVGARHLQRFLESEDASAGKNK